MSRVRVGVLVVLLVAASAGTAVASPTSPAAVGGADAPTRSVEDSGPEAAPAPADRARSCFPPGGHDLEIGTEGPRVFVTVHTSLFTNLTNPGAFGVEAVGTTGSVDVVTLRAGVLFEGVGDPTGFLADPFSRFSIAFHYRFQLPVFEPYGHGVDYEEDQSPVGGVNASAC